MRHRSIWLKTSQMCHVLIKAGFLWLKLHQNGTQCHITGNGKSGEVENGMQSCCGVSELVQDILDFRNSSGQDRTQLWFDLK